MDATARYGLPDRLRTRAGSVGAWVHVVGSLQKIFCGTALVVLAFIGIAVVWTDLRETPMIWAVLPALGVAWLGLRHGALLEAVGNDLIGVARGLGDPHGALESALSRLCSVLLYEAVFGAIVSIAVAIAVVLA